MLRTKTLSALAALAALALSAASAQSYEQCASGCGDAAISCSGIGDGRDCSTPRSQCLAECQFGAGNQRSGPPKYGAFAYSQNVQGMGTAYDWPDRPSAENSAMASCRNLSSAATDCQIVIWFYNNCAAFALAPDGSYGAGYGARKYIAEGYALQYCRQYGGDRCVVRKSVCTGV